MEKILGISFFVIIYVGVCYMLLQILYFIGDKISHLTGTDERITPKIAEKIVEIGKEKEL